VSDRPGPWIEDMTAPEVAERLSAGDIVLLPIGARAKDFGDHADRAHERPSGHVPLAPLRLALDHPHSTTSSRRPASPPPRCSEPVVILAGFNYILYPPFR
jgi:hypothetical protein